MVLNNIKAIFISQDMEDKNSYDYRYINFCIVLGIFLIGIPIFSDYIFYNKPFFLRNNTDLIRANFPVYTMIYNNLINGWSNWSWEMGIGTSMLTHADAVFDPFTYIIFILGKCDIAYMMGVMMFVKLFFEGITFSYYVRFFKFHPYAVLISSIMYAYSGYSMIMGSNLALGTILVYFPFVLLSIEKYICNKEWKALTVVYFLICIYSFYYFYVTFILSIIYYVFRLYCYDRLSITKVASIFKPIIFSILLSSFVFIPEILLVFGSDRINGGKDVVLGSILFKPDFDLLMSVISRIINIDFLGDNLVFPYLGKRQDYFSPEVFVSFCSIPLILYYLIQLKKQKSLYFIKYVILLFFTLIVVIFPFFSYVMNAFSTINYRWYFVLHLFICVISAEAFDYIINQKKVVVKDIIVTLLLTSCFIMLCSIVYMYLKIDCKQLVPMSMLDYMEYVVSKYIYTIVLFISIGGCSVYYNCAKNKISLVGIGIIILAIIGTGYFWGYREFFRYDSSSYISEEHSLYGYYDASSNVIEKIKLEDDSFYRIYKDFDSVYDWNGIASDNDALIQEYYGLKSYNSLNNSSYINFLQSLGVYVATPNALEVHKRENRKPKDIKGPELNYINGIDDKYNLLTYLNVKYYLTKNITEIPSSFEYLYQCDGIYVYRNKENTNLAMIKPFVITEEKFFSQNELERNKTILSHYVYNGNMNTSSGDVKSEMCSFNKDNFKMSISVSGSEKWIVLSVPYDKGWRCSEDGKIIPIEKIDIGMIGVKIDSGEHILEFSYFPYGMREGMYLSFFTFFVFCVLIYKEKIS